MPVGSVKSVARVGQHDAFVQETGPTQEYIIDVIHLNGKVDRR